MGRTIVLVNTGYQDRLARAKEHCLRRIQKGVSPEIPIAGQARKWDVSAIELAFEVGQTLGLAKGNPK